ncbi:unnamed protein product [Caenorhabditis sp. 36 PRJEB53466]|nr:unnamed protein product [Caenorhabditis sp. 36 PRJEB53466]
MAKKSKSTPPALWKKMEIDFKGEKTLEKNDKTFEEVTNEQLNEKIVDHILQSGQKLNEVLDTLIQLKDYLQARSDRLFEAFDAKIKQEFEDIRITLPQPFDETRWQELETMNDEDLNEKDLLFNGIPASAIMIVNVLETLLKELNVHVNHVDVFPFEIDSYEIEAKMNKFCTQRSLKPVNLLATSLEHTPKAGMLDTLMIPSFFLEYTADKLDYTKKENKEEFLEKLKAKFGSLKVTELKMVLPDILIAYTTELVDRMMQVSYFIPHELLRLMFLCWNPEIVYIRLRSEACSSIEDAARIEWDEEEVFTSTTLFNSELYTRCEPVPLGNELEIVDCAVIIDATGSRLFDPIHNAKNVKTAGRDLLITFSNKIVLVKRIVPFKNGASINAQLKQQLEFVANTFFSNASEHPLRTVHHHLTFTNSGETKLIVVKKFITKMASAMKLGITFNIEQTVKAMFNHYGDSRPSSDLLVRLFDQVNHFQLDMKEMPFFGSKKSEKKEKPKEEPSYPRQQAVPPPPQVAHHPVATYPQSTFVYQPNQYCYAPTDPRINTATSTSTTYTMAFPRNDLPGASANFCEGFLDGPDFSNRVPDRRIPPAPGSYYFFSHGNMPPPALTPGMMPGCSSAPPPGSTSSCPPPPSYEDVLAQEVKKKL